MTIQLPGQCGDLVERQHGVLARWQATDCEVNLSAVDALVRRGRWRPLYRGVYYTRAGPSSRTTMLWAAARRCGPEAALSHFTAAELDGIADSRRDAIHVTIPARARVTISDAEFGGEAPRVIVHRSGRLEQARHPVKGPPRTRVEETVLDLTDLARTFDMAFSWLSLACSRRLATPDQIRAAVIRRPRVRRRREILGALEQISDGVSSNLERECVRRVERPHGLPRPRRQARMRRGTRSAYLDNLYAEFKVAVELDGLGSHPAESRWQDIHRDNHFATTGIITLRYSRADVTERPCRVAAEIAMVLWQRGWTGELRSCSSSCRAA